MSRHYGTPLSRRQFQQRVSYQTMSKVEYGVKKIFATAEFAARGWGYVKCLEPISKSSEEDNEAGELDKAEEVLSVVLPADEDATLPLYPGEEALDEPASHVTV